MRGCPGALQCAGYRFQCDRIDGIFTPGSAPFLEFHAAADPEWRGKPDGHGLQIVARDDGFREPLQFHAASRYGRRQQPLPLMHRGELERAVIRGPGSVAVMLPSIRRGDADLHAGRELSIVAKHHAPHPVHRHGLEANIVPRQVPAGANGDAGGLAALHHVRVKRVRPDEALSLAGGRRRKRRVRLGGLLRRTSRGHAALETAPDRLRFEQIPARPESLKGESPVLVGLRQSHEDGARKLGRSLQLHREVGNRATVAIHHAAAQSTQPRQLRCQSHGAAVRADMDRPRRASGRIRPAIPLPVERGDVIARSHAGDAERARAVGDGAESHASRPRGRQLHRHRGNSAASKTIDYRTFDGPAGLAPKQR